MNLKCRFLLLTLLVLFISCDKKRVFDDYQKIGNVWVKDSIVNFKYENTDTITNYNLFLNIRCDNDYPFNNIFLITKVEDPKGFTIVDTLEYKMANPDGSLLGEGFTDLKESKLYFKENFQFKLLGMYHISIQQAIRETGKVNGVESLNGIKDIGFRIELKE